MRKIKPTTPQTFTAKMRGNDEWHVLREDDTTLAIVPNTHGTGQWTAERIAELMTGRDAACVGWQAAEAEAVKLRTQIIALQAKLDALQPVADAAMDYYIGWKSGGGESGRAAFLKQGRAYAQAQAQAGQGES